MRLLALSFTRFFARTPWTTLTALLGVSLGVASTVAVHLISLSVAEALDSSRLPHLRGVTHLAEKRAATMNDYFDLRRRWRGGELPEVLGLVPLVEGQVVEDGRRLHVVGADWLAVFALPGGEALEEFRPGSILLDASLGVAAGDELHLGSEAWPVAGVLESGVEDGLFADIGDALYLLRAPPDRLSHVGVSLRDPWQVGRSWLENLLPGLSAGLPEQTSHALAGWRLRPVSVQQPGAGFANSILFNLGALGSLALLVAWFLIYQVCVVWLRRQVPVLDSLFALGVGRGELAVCFLASVALLGVLATFLGMAAGILLADLLTGISTAGLDAAPSPDFSAAVVVKAFVSGMGITLIGAWMAFRRWRRAERHSARRSALATGWFIRFAAALGLIAVGVGIENTGLVGGFAAILAAALLTASVVAPLLRVLRRRMAGNARASGTVRGLLARLAIREATWFEGDVGTALGALVLAVATSAGVGLMVDSFKIDFERMLTQRLAHEFFVEMPQGNLFAGGAASRSAAEAFLAGGTASRSAAEAFLARGAPSRSPAEGSAAGTFAVDFPGARAGAYGSLRTRIDGRAVEIGHGAFSAAEAARYGYAGALRADEGLASESLLRALDVDIGEDVEVGGLPVRIVGAFADFGAVVPRLLLQDEAAARRFGDLHFTGMGISNVSRAELDAWLAAYAPGARVQQREAARARALEIFDRSFAITNALTLLALIVAVVGIYNAMVGLRLNRLATRQLLTALGVTAAEDRYIELVRALGLGALAVLLALPLGLAMGAILCAVINPRAFGWSIELTVSAAALAWPMALGFLAAVAAAVAPSPKERLRAF